MNFNVSVAMPRAISDPILSHLPRARRISWSVFVEASLIRVLSSCSVVGGGRGGGDVDTVLHKTPTKKKSIGVRSDHSIGSGRHFTALTNVAVPSGQNAQLTPTLHHIKTFSVNLPHCLYFEIVPQTSCS